MKQTTNIKIVEGSTYAKALSKLKKSGQDRPMTILELAKVRINNSEYFDLGFDTCNAVVYSGTGKFKVITQCKELIDLKPDFNNYCLATDYSKIQSSEIEIDDTFNHNLTYKEVLKHKGWLALFENDKQTLKKYADIVFKSKERAMGFYICNIKDTLRGVWLYDMSNYSNVDCVKYLSSGARFLLKLPSSLDITKKQSSEFDRGYNQCKKDIKKILTEHQMLDVWEIIK